jgi:hypothetical protein
MGNLARPGYGATTDGMWPYTQVFLYPPLNSLTFTRFNRYDSCDVGTFPNQTNADGLGPAAALHSDASQAKYNYRLSYLTGQKTSCVVADPCRFPTNPVIRSVRAPAQARTTLARAIIRVVVLRKLMSLRPSTINRVLAV